MLNREIIAVCSQIQTKPVNILWAERSFFCMLYLMVHIVTTRFQNIYCDVAICYLKTGS